MASRDANRPNVIVIMSDDQGYWAFPGVGSPEPVAPNLARLAREGTRLDRFFCASPVCSPARASIVTGRMPSAHGVHDWIVDTSHADRDPWYLRDIPLTADAFHSAGFACGLSGKWHLGGGGTHPAAYELWYAHRGSAGPYNAAPMWRDGELITEDRYISAAIVDEACSRLAEWSTTDQPFYLEVNFTAPHRPWLNQHPSEFIEPYRESPPPNPYPGRPHPWAKKDSLNIKGYGYDDPMACLTGYLAAITGMDYHIGRLMEALHAHRLTRSTIVVFLSDNGFSAGHRGLWGKGNATEPLNLWDPSIRVPGVFWQPGRIRAGHVEQQLLSAVDLRPTLLSLAGVSDFDDPLAAGRSFADSLIESLPDSAPREHVVVYDEYGGARMIRTAEHKLIVRSAGPTELYVLNDDPDELENRAGDRQLRASRVELETALADWFRGHTLAMYDGYREPVIGAGQIRPMWQQQSSPAFQQGPPRRAI